MLGPNPKHRQFTNLDSTFRRSKQAVGHSVAQLKSQENNKQQRDSYKPTTASKVMQSLAQYKLDCEPHAVIVG